jgi:GNAT superfamily N-acetyltransferase
MLYMETSINGDFTIDDSRTRINFHQVQEMVKDAYWSKNISLEEIKKGAGNSALVLGTYNKEGQQVGYLRVISDKTRFAYILDVYVHALYRKQGIGQAMVSFAMQHPDFADVYQWLLVTKDAHGVYKKVGFQPLAEPDNWLCLIKPRPER